MKTEAIQIELKKAGLDGWLFFDHQTHDDRPIIPWTCFSIEPALYLPDFGVRTEVNVFVEEQGARVTGEMQKGLLQL